MFYEEYFYGIGALFLLLIFLAFPVYVLIRLYQINQELLTLKRGSRHSEGGPYEAPREIPAAKPPSPPPPAPPSPPRAPEPPPVPAFVQPTPPPPTRSAPEPAVSGRPPRDLESLLGANWLSKVGIAAVAIAAAFFLKYAFDSGWIGPTGRVVIGLLASLLLMGLGQYLLGKATYSAFAQVLLSGGIVVFFLSIFAAFAYYHLIGFTLAFAALAIAALLGSAVALRNNTQAVAFLCLLGAFLTPLLIHEPQTGAGAPIRLYAYLAGLNIWSLLLLRYRPWHSLTLLSFASTWGIFFITRPAGRTDYLTVEAFVILFLIISCYAGLTSLPKAARKEEGELPVKSASPEVAGILMILGCLSFALASALTLTGIVAFGLPTLALIGVFLALLLIGLALLMGQYAADNTALAKALQYLAGLALVALVMLPVISAPTLRPAEVWPSFIFIVLVNLIFLATALRLAKDPAGKIPAQLLIIANAISQAAAAFHVLSAAYIWKVSALPLWLPIAGWLSLLTFWGASRQRPRLDNLLITLLLCAQGLAFLAFFAAGQRLAGPNSRMLILFSAEFLLLSLTWVALRKAALLPGFRGDLLGAFGNAAIFFALFSLAFEKETYQGLVILCGLAVAFALYHAVIGALVMRRPTDNPLARMIYLGLALTFLTIALPLQLKRSYLTLAWAAESAILIWTGLAINERRARWYGLILLAIAIGKACFLDLGFFELRSEPFRLLLNERFLSGAATIIALYLAAGWFWRRRDILAEGEIKLVAPLVLAANLLTLLFVSLELWDYGGQFTAAFQENLQQLLLSIFWSVYALGAVLIGFWKRSRPLRLFAITLLYLAILKVFLFDLGFLSQPYRIISIFGLGIILLVVSFLYTRFEGRLKCGG